jgi:hypothetical protein
MKTFYRIASAENGDVLFKKRKIAKAYHWWLRENGLVSQTIITSEQSSGVEWTDFKTSGTL